MESYTLTKDKRRGGVYISHGVGFILVLLCVCLSVLVGLIVHLTSTGKVVCNCGTTKDDNSGISNEQLTERCVELVQKGQSKICNTCDEQKQSSIESSSPTFPWTSPSSLSASLQGIGSSSTPPSTHLSTPPTTAKPVINYRLPRSVVPKHYDLELQPEIYGNDSSEFTFNGTVVISLSVIRAVREITLHKKHIAVDNVSVSQTSGGVLNVPSVVKTSYDKVTEIFTVQVDRDLEPGISYSIELSFHGKMRTDGEGLYVTSYKDDNITVFLATTQFETPDARSAFPCFDEPGLKATFNVTLVRKLNTGRNYRTLSNTEKIDTEIRGGYAADRYATTPVMSTYLLAFIVCDFQYVENVTSNITYRTFARPNAIQYAMTAQEYGLSLLDWFVERFQPPYPLNKLDNIAIPNFVSGAMENWGLITYRERILNQPGLTTASEDSWTVEAISHEICHQWFGNIVSPKWWWWLWLNEAFASFWDFHAVEAVYPARRETEQFVVQSMHSAFSVDSVLTSHPLTTDVESQDETDGSFDAIVYRKGGSIVRMMHFIMGEDLLIKSLNFYLSRHQYGNADSMDLLEALTQKSSELGTPINMTYLIDPWVAQKNFPVVMVTVLGTGVINVKQQRFLDNMTIDNLSEDAPYGYQWSIPITVASSSDTSNFNRTYSYTDIQWLHQTERNITDDVIPDPSSPDVWVMVNLHQTGFYRVNYEETNWRAIIKQLEMEHQIFPPINRAQVINDAFSLQKAGLLSMDIALRTLNFLKDDTEYTAWRAFSREIELLDRMLERSDLYGAFKAFMRTSIRKSFLQHRMNIKEEDLPFVTYHVTRSSIYACKYGLTECVEDSLRLHRDWMDNTTKPIHPDLQSVVLCNAVRYGGQEEWNFAYRQYTDSPLSSIREDAMDALTCTTEPWLLDRILHMALNTSLIKKADARSVIDNVGRNPVGRGIAWQFVKSNFKRLHKVLGKSSLSTLVRTMATDYNTQYYISELQSFGHASLAPGYDSTFKRALATAQENTDWMSSNYDVIKDWLTEQGLASYMY